MRIYALFTLNQILSQRSKHKCSDSRTTNRYSSSKRPKIEKKKKNSIYTEYIFKFFFDNTIKLFTVSDRNSRPQ